MATDMSENLPYSGEESELRDVLEDIFNTNSSKMDFQDVLKAVLNHTQVVTDHDVVNRIEQVSEEINVYESQYIIVL